MATLPNNAADQLSESIKAQQDNIAPFQFYDSVYEADYRFRTADKAIAAANEKNWSAVSYFETGKEATPEWFKKQPDGDWVSDKGRSIYDVQAERDKAQLEAIEKRSELRQSLESFSDDAKLANADRIAFTHISDETTKRFAAVAITDNKELSEGYKNSVEQNSAFSKEVSEFNAANDRMIIEKEERKALDMEALQTSSAFSVAPTSEIGNELPQELQQNFKAFEQNYKGQQATNENDQAQDTAPATDVEAGTAPAKPALEEIVISDADQARLAAIRARDTEAARLAAGLNTIEPDIEREKLKAKGQEAAQNAWVAQAQAAQAASQEQKPKDGNRVASDEVFTAEGADVAKPKPPIIPKEVADQYVQVGSNLHYKNAPDKVAIEDKGNRLQTLSNSETVAENMVRVAHARGWDEIKVTGSETFRREAWLEAAARGMSVRGYTPNDVDKAMLAERQKSMPANTVEAGQAHIRARESASPAANAPSALDTARPAAAAAAAATAEAKAKDAAPAAATAEAKAKDGKPANDAADLNKQRAEAIRSNPNAEAVVKKHPELASAVAAINSIEVEAKKRGLTPEQQAQVMQRVRETAANSIERGNIPKVEMREEKEVERRREKEKEQER